MTDTKPQLLHHGNNDGGLACLHAYRGVPSLKNILDIRTSNYKKILVLKYFY